MYRIIDLKGIDVSGNGATIPGIYDRIEGTTKALLIKGLNDGTNVLHDFIATVELSSGDYVVAVGALHSITITSADKVTFE